MILRDYRCPEHGLFESSEAQCRHDGCEQAVTVAFLKPVGQVSARTRGIDRELRAVAASFGMTNMRSAREGDNQLGYMPDAVPVEVPGVAARMPENIKWGSHKMETQQGTLFNTAGVMGADKMGLHEAQKSPLQALSTLGKQTVVSHTAPGIKRTDSGLSE